MNITICGGLGIEVKQYRYSKEIPEIMNINIGGSGWYCAFILRALNQTPIIISRYGRDGKGLYIEQVLKKNNMTYYGVVKGQTQLFNASLCDGEVESYVSYEESPSLLELEHQLDNNYYNDFVIVAFNTVDIIKYFCDNLNYKFKVANLSGSIFDFINKYDIRNIKGFDIVTLNAEELITISKKYSLKSEEIMSILMLRNRKVFVTYKDHILYSENNSIKKYEYDQLKNVYDVIGAGDAFATALSVYLYNGVELIYSIKNAVQIAQKMCVCKNKEYIEAGAWTRS